MNNVYFIEKEVAMHQSGVNKGQNLLDVQANNRSLILGLLKQKQVASRAELAKLSGLKNATITNIINEFIRYGLVKEQGLLEGKKGHRSIAVVLDCEYYAVAGIILSREASYILLFDLNGSVLDGQSIKFQKGWNFSEFIDNTIKQAVKYLKQDRKQKILAIGVTVPGPYYQDMGKSDLIPGSPEWNTVCVRDKMEEAFDFPIIIEQDANAGALATWEKHMDMLCEDTMVYLALDNGIGAGIVREGCLFTGGFGTAGEIGHISVDYDGEPCICGNRGCATVQASISRLMKKVRERISAGERSLLSESFEFEALIDAIKKKDPVAYSEYKKMVVYLGRTITNAIWAYSPQFIFLGERLAWIGEMLVQDIEDYLREHLSPAMTERVKIQLADELTIESSAVVLGTGLLAIKYVFSHMELFSEDH